MSVIVWPKKNIYRGKSRNEILQQLKHALEGRCESAWLFGSYARKEERDGSDIDLVVVKSTRQPQIERVREFDDIWNIFPAIDLIVYTPTEFAKIREHPGSGFRKSMVNEMIRLV